MDNLKEYEIKIAEIDETEEILSLLKNVANALKEKGSNQWESLRTGQEDHDILKTIKKSQTYTVKKDNRLIATFTIYPEASSWDVMLWKDTDVHAVYLHKLAITPEESGRGLGKQILGWLERKLKRDGIDMLRLDCIADNEKLNTFYENAGYKKAGIRHGFSLFVKSLY